jgi:hypothetical protein
MQLPPQLSTKSGLYNLRHYIAQFQAIFDGLKLLAYSQDWTDIKDSLALVGVRVGLLDLDQSVIS